MQSGEKEKALTLCRYCSATAKTLVLQVINSVLDTNSKLAGNWHLKILPEFHQFLECHR